MKYNELTTEQKRTLAAWYLHDKNTEAGEGTSYAELADPFDFVDAAEVADYYEGDDFTVDELRENLGYDPYSDPEFDPLHAINCSTYDLFSDIYDLLANNISQAEWNAKRGHLELEADYNAGTITIGDYKLTFAPNI